MKNCIAVLLIGCIFTNAYASNSDPISIDEVMRLTEINSPHISAAQLREIVANKSVDIARSKYFPTLSAEAIDSTGFPGSSGSLGVTGLAGSPFRSGAAVGVVAEQIIWDFGRTYYDVEASRYEVELSHENTRVTRYQIKQIALEVYYNCAFYRSQSENWQRLSHESKIITKEAHHFVNTGQVSIVDRYLSKAQTEEAETTHRYFQELYKKSTEELGIILGLPASSLTCPILASNLSTALNTKHNRSITPPLVSQAIASSKIACARLKQEKANYYPKIVAVASAGVMEDTHMVDKKDYAAGIGVIWPILDLHTTGKIRQAQAELSARNEDISSQKRYINEMNAKYDAIIDASSVRLQNLDNEFINASKAFNTAKNRYFSLEGQLVDLREAFRNISRVSTQIDETRTKLLQARGMKALLNGGG